MEAKRHFCRAYTWDGDFGPAIEICVEYENGRFVVGNGEYSSEVFFCPFCGVQAPSPPRCKCNFGGSICRNCHGHNIPLVYSE